MFLSWPRLLPRPLSSRHRPLLPSARRPFVRPQLEALEDRCVPSVSTVAATQDFATGSSVPVAVSFQLDQNGNVWELNPTLGISGANANLAQLSTSKTGQWRALAATFGTDGNPVLFAVNRADGSLWEHSLVFGDKTASGTTASEADADLNWRKISSGNFSDVSATVAVTVGANGSPSGVNAVVFGVMSGDGSLWEHNLAFGDQNAQGAVSEATVDANWRELSTGSFTHVAAAQAFLPTLTQNSGAAGVPANPLTLLPANPIVFALTANGNVWEHNVNLTSAQTSPQAEQTTNGDWFQISSGAFRDVAAVLDFTVSSGANAALGPAHPVLFAVASGSGNIWEHNSAMSAGAAAEQITDANWALISSGDFTRLAAALDVEPAGGATPLTVSPVLFATVNGSGNLWEHNDLLDPANGEFTTDANWALLSTGNAGQFAATLSATVTAGASPTVTGGKPAAYAVTGDLNLWQHVLGSAVGAVEATTDGNWSALSTGLPFAAAPIPVLTGAPSTALVTLNLPALHINLLGLHVDTTGPIQVTVSAQPGPGQLLGNLLTDVSGLLNLKGVNNALNTVLASVVGLVNSASLSVSGVDTTGGPLSNAQAATTPVLDLFVAPVHLNLLGAVVDTSPIHLTITAQSGQGLVLGNVVADLANLFNPPLPAQLNLDTINAKLQQLLGELNQQIPNIGSSTTTAQTTGAGTEQVVSLIVPPINVDLLGLILKTSQIQVNANAITGNGDLLGNVLTTLLNTLGATPQNLSQLNSNLNALLAKVVGVLNATSLLLPSGAVGSLTQVLQTLSLPNLVNTTGTASTPILNLAIASSDGTTPPVNVNLLGLQITTSNIQAQLIAQTGDGQVLGNLLYNVANLLNPGGAINLLTILNQLGL